MALPTSTSKSQVETTVIDLIAEVEREEAETTTLEATPVATQGAAALPAKATDTAAAVAEQLAPVTSVADFLAEQGFTDVQIGFGSFPTIVLKDGTFTTTDHPRFGTEFEFKFLAERPNYLFKGDVTAIDRSKPEELHYSVDGITTTDGQLIADIQKDWYDRGVPHDRTSYKLLLVDVLDTDLAGEVCEIQIPPLSQPIWNGFISLLARRGVRVADVVIQAFVGAEVGSGKKAFNPIRFKRIG